MSKYHLGSSEGQKVDAEAIINRILEGKGANVSFSEAELKELISSCRYVLIEQPIVLDLMAPVKIVGSIHGHLGDLLHIFKTSGHPSDTNYLFLGNYVDRGPMSLQCIVLLVAYKLRYPQNIFLLRGSHEISSTNRNMGFHDQCKRKASLKVWKMFNQLFNVLPLCALIERKIFCVHGGLSPQLQLLQQLNKIPRPLEITNQGIPIDLLWSDPQPFATGWQENERGVSYVFGMDSVVNFLRDNHLEMIVRSHQLVELGYQFLFNKMLCTLFSVPDFLGEYNNFGAVMVVQQGLKCSFEITKPKSNPRVQYIDKPNFKK